MLVAHHKCMYRITKRAYFKLNVGKGCTIMFVFSYNMIYFYINDHMCLVHQSVYV